MGRGEDGKEKRVWEEESNFIKEKRRGFMVKSRESPQATSHKEHRSQQSMLRPNLQFSVFSFQKQSIAINNIPEPSCFPPFLEPDKYVGDAWKGG